MTVRELIVVLQAFPPDLQVCYGLYSECCLLEAGDIHAEDLLPARDDGWVPNGRPDQRTERYVVFPGN